MYYLNVVGEQEQASAPAVDHKIKGLEYGEDDEDGKDYIEDAENNSREEHLDT